MGTKDTFDTCFDNIITILEAYSLTQDVAERFAVYPDLYRDSPENTDIAQVFVYLLSITQTERTTTGFFQYDAAYQLDLIAKAKGTRIGATYSNASRAAGVRLRYLEKQVMNALFPAGNRSLSLGSGKVSKKEFNISAFIPESQTAERPIAAARMTLTVGLAWEPEALTGDELTAVMATADKWAALVEP